MATGSRRPGSSRERVNCRVGVTFTYLDSYHSHDYFINGHDGLMPIGQLFCPSWDLLYVVTLVIKAATTDMDTKETSNEV